jgi:hypothetical protein
LAQFQCLAGDFMSNHFVWLLFGAFLLVVAISALATEAAVVLNAPRRPRASARWSVDLDESTVTAPTSQANPDGSSTPT